MNKPVDRPGPGQQGHAEGPDSLPQSSAAPGSPSSFPSRGPSRAQAHDQLAEENLRQRLADSQAENSELRLFNSRLAHEVRTQVRTIDGMSALLLGHDERALDTGSARLLKLVRASAARLGHTMDDLLALAQVAHQPLRSESIDLAKLAESIATVLCHANPQRDVRLSVALGMQATGDPGLLRLALSNLIGNAWKFTRNVEVAEIEVGQRPTAGENVFFVRDNGAGFDMRHAGKLFEPFERLHRQEEFDGTGIGLSLVRRIIERHRGRIWVEAAEGKGAIFFFTLG